MSVQDQLWSWARQLKPWQSDLARRLFQSSTLSPEETSEVKSILLTSIGTIGPNELQIKPITLEEKDIPRLASRTGSTRISRLYNLENIGAIEPNQRLDFDLNGLTVVYGDNGTGKSSYARVLKEACRASDRSTKILPNIFTTPNTTQTTEGRSKIEFDQNGLIQILDRKSNTPPSPDLSTISVFDSGCADVYLSTPNTIAYTPQILSIFKRLAETQERIHAELQDDTDKLRLTKPSFGELENNPYAKSWIEAIDEKTSDDEIRSFTNLSPSEKERLRTLETSLQDSSEEDSSKTITRLQRAITEATRIKKALSHSLQSIPSNIASNIEHCQREIESAQADVRRLSASFSPDTIHPNSSSPLWRALWSATNDYCNSLPRSAPAADSNDGQSHCPLCLQELLGETRSRFRDIRELTSGIIEKNLKQCQIALDTQIQKISSIIIPTINPTDYLIFEDSPAIEKSISEFTAFVSNTKSAMEAAILTKDWSKIPTPYPPPTKHIDTWIEDTEARLTLTRSLVSPESRALLQREWHALQTRNQLSLRIDDLVKLPPILQKTSRLSKAQAALSTKSLTQAQTRLTDLVVTEELRRCLSSELKLLNLEHLNVKINSRGVKGKTVIEIQPNSSTSYKLSDILSEGETRALTLAFFLAEVTSGAHDGGVIFDDPVSSLDHERRDNVARRLAKEASARQVIVFTHDIVFLHMLRRHAETEGSRFKEQVIRRSSGRVGVTDSDVPWKAMSCEKQQGYLRNKIPELRKAESSGNADTYAELAKHWLGMLRSSWERAVEDKLLGGVVSRFNPEVHTKKLSAVRVTADLIKAVNEGMTTCSNWVHDQAMAINSAPPTADELEAQLNKYKGILDQFK